MIIIISIIAIIILVLVFNSGEGATKKAMRGSYNRIKNSTPGMIEEFYLKEALRVRFRSWPDYKLEEFISDCYDIDSLAHKIYTLEQKGII